MIEFNFKNKKIKAETLNDAINEFVLMCMDPTEYANTNDPYEKDYREEPIGYTKGKRNKDYNQHRFYEIITIKWNEDGEDKEYKLTRTEFFNWHLKQKNLLENKNSNQNNSKTMISLNNHIAIRSQEIRKMKQKAFYQTISLKKELASKEKSLSEEINKMNADMDMLNKQMSILKTYTGIERDVVKIRGGKPSSQKHIDVFQKFRYMNVEMEILTDMNFFDALSIEEFDKFLAERYKEIMPSERSIQAFKVTKNDIKYEDFFKTLEMKKYNDAVYILIRDGENLYRIFNNYKLHENKLFVSDQNEEYDEILKLIEKDNFRIDDYTKNMIESFRAYKSGTENKGYIQYRINYNINSCSIIYRYNEEILNKLLKEAESEIEYQLKKRRDYITKYGLEDELDEYSWRWGVRVGNIYNKAYEKYLEVRRMMEFYKAFDENDKLTLTTLKIKSPYSVLYFDKREKTELELIDDGIGVFGCEFYRGRNVTEFSENIDPITMEPYFYRATYYDFDKFMDHAKESIKDDVEKLYKDHNYKNFHSIAILQNILDSKFCFKDIEPVDLMMQSGMEQLNFIYDSEENLIGSSKNFESIVEELYSTIDDVEKNEFFVLMTHDITLLDKTYAPFAKYEESFYEPIVFSCCKKSNGKIEGLFDVYTKSQYSKNIYPGDRKVSKKEIGEKDRIIKLDKKEKILSLLKNRTFRDQHDDIAKRLKKAYWIMDSVKKREYNVNGIPLRY